MLQDLVVFGFLSSWEGLCWMIFRFYSNHYTFCEQLSKIWFNWEKERMNLTKTTKQKKISRMSSITKGYGVENHTMGNCIYRETSNFVLYSTEQHKKPRVSVFFFLYMSKRIICSLMTKWGLQLQNWKKENYNLSSFLFTSNSNQ